MASPKAIAIKAEAERQTQREALARIEAKLDALAAAVAALTPPAKAPRS